MSTYTVELNWYSVSESLPDDESLVFVLYRDRDRAGNMVLVTEANFTSDFDADEAWTINGGCLDGEAIPEEDVIAWADPVDIIPRELRR